MTPPKLTPEEISSSWHLDKSINVHFMISVIMLLIAAFGYVLHQDQRQTIVETKVEGLSFADVQLKEELKTVKVDLKDDLRRIEGKLDRMISKGGK